MEVRLESLHIENFKGVEKTVYSFGERTKVFGANATGKTTMFDAFTWLLFGKDSAGNAKFNVRPLDLSGKQKDNLEIKVMARLEVAGEPIQLERVQKQKWTKRRGSDEATLTGNVNEYSVNGYPRSEKEYGEYIDSIISEDTFMLLTNPMRFPMMDWKEQRALLMHFCDNQSDAELADAELANEIAMAPTAEDVQKKYQKKVGECKKKRLELAAKIEALEKLKANEDVSEYELERQECLKLLEKNEEHQKKLEADNETLTNLSERIMQLRFREGDMRAEASKNGFEKRSNLRVAENDLVLRIRCAEAEKTEAEKKIEQATNERNRLRDLGNEANEKFKEIKNRVLDEKNLSCPTCHRDYNPGEQKQIMERFEEQRKIDLDRIREYAQTLTDEVAEQKRLHAEQTKKHEEALKIIAELQKELAKVKAEIETIQVNVLPETDEYKAVVAEIEDKTRDFESMKDTPEELKKARDEREQLSARLLQAMRKIDSAKRDTEIDETIAEIMDDQREIAQQEMLAEKMLYMYEAFLQRKMKKVSEVVNAVFDCVKWKLFEQQLNGGVKETCECTVNGVPFGALNTGHRIVAGLQIVKALQKLYGVYAPVFVDNCEAVSEGNLPNMDCQTICMYVSNDKKIRLEV